MHTHVAAVLSCGCCGKRKRYRAPCEKALRKMVADSGWVPDGDPARCLCSRCWRAYWGSLVSALRVPTRTPSARAFL